jgi:acyl-CoA synthetase (NDP forming)
MLDPLFKPRSVAIIGASNNPLSIGHIIIQNLIDHGFKGPIFPVNPKNPYIKSFKAYKSVLDIPDEVDLVNISIKNTLVPMAIEECGKKGVKFVIVHTAGFKEVGGEGEALEKQMVEIAHKYGMRVYGPNSQGIQNSDEDVSVYANFTFVPMTQGNISILAQSGGVGEVLKLHLDKIGMGIRMYASYGNECDVSMNEILEYYGQDDGAKVIMLHIETLKDPIGFLEIARKISKIKPVLAVKSGKTKEGLKAVSSHTGTLMEKDVTTDVIFRKAGVIRFDTQDEMIQTAIALSSQPEPKGNRVAIVTNTGGPGILAVDECIQAGLELAHLTDDTKAFLKERLMPMASLENPVDVIATAGPEHYGAAIEGLMNDPNVDSILINFISAPFVDLDGIAATIAEWGPKATKPIVVVLMTIEKWGRLLRTIRKGGIPVYEFPETGAKVLINMTRYGLYRHAAETEFPKMDVKKADVDKLFGGLGEGYISQADAFAALDAYGIPTVKMIKASGEAEIKSAAKDLSFPVVLKVDAKEIVHKSDEGGIALNLKDKDELIAAWKVMDKKFSKHNPAYVVQEQLGEAVETIIGVNNTEGIGPIIMFGLGGIFVEVMKDVQFRLCPLSRGDADGMIADIRGQAILEGVRGKAGADVESLKDILLRISQLAMDHPRILEMDLNPVFSFAPGKGSKVVDIRIRLAGK